MRILLAIVLLLICSLAGAVTLRAQDPDGTTVTISTDKTCTDEVVLSQLPGVNKLLKERGVPPVPVTALGAAAVLYKGKIFGACWARRGDTGLVIGDAGLPSIGFFGPAGEFAVVQEI